MTDHDHHAHHEILSHEGEHDHRLDAPQSLNQLAFQATVHSSRDAPSASSGMVIVT